MSSDAGDSSEEEVRSAAPSAKRKRRDTTAATTSNQRRRTATVGRSDDEGQEELSDEAEGSDSQGGSLDADNLYDPDQPLEERRKVQRDIRGLLKNITENSEEYLQSGSTGLKDAIDQANSYLKKIKRPGEAATDSRLLVSTTDLSYRKTLRLTHGSLAQGVDVDDFVSKCITYMRQGRGIEDDDAPELSSTQRHRRSVRPRQRDDDDDEIGDEGDMMNWPHLGRFAVLPNIRRPALPGFLLGPLSVEKKARKITKRSAPLRHNDLTEIRPEVLDIESLAKKENDLTAICGNILKQLESTQADLQEKVASLMEDDMTEQQQERIMHKYGLRTTGGIDIMRFVVNPKSFGQSVENLFYVSFLIRDGRVKVEYDDNELPALAPVERETDEEPSVRHSGSKHQAILSLDMETWQDIIDTMGIKEPMIAHRVEITQEGPGAKGWYS